MSIKQKPTNKHDIVQIVRERLSNEIKYVLQDYPDGLKCNQLQQEYEIRYGKTIKPHQYDYQSLIHLFSSLTHVFDTIMAKIIILKEQYRQKTPHMLIFEPTQLPEPTLGEDFTANNLIEVKVTNIYDPSKFWIVSDIRELNAFSELLRRFYKKPTNCIKVPVTQLNNNLLCVVDRCGLYYRAIIINNSLYTAKKVRVFFIDEGLILNVDVRNVYYMNKRFEAVPRFAKRARLAYICPKGGNILWSGSQMRAFVKLISKKRLCAKICWIEKNTNAVNINLRELCRVDCSLINDLMVKKGFAMYTNELMDKNGNIKKEHNTVLKYGEYESKTDFLYIFPDFERLETGQTPSSMYELDQLKMGVQLDLILGPYLKYVGSKDKMVLKPHKKSVI